jgi:hypothetical protein
MSGLPRLAFVAVLVLAIAGCGADRPDLLAPVITQAYPAAVQPGEQITVLGRALGGSGRLEAQPPAPFETVSWTTTQVKIRVPSGTPPGEYRLVLRIGEAAAGPVAVKVKRAPPRLVAVNPDRGKVGDWVTVTGESLGGGKANAKGKVFFHEAPATEVSAWEDTSIRFRIPTPVPKAAREWVWIEVDGTSSSELGFHLVRPLARNVVPKAAPAGTVIGIEGSDFGAARGEILFGAKNVPGAVEAWSETLIRARVPPGLSGECPVRVRNVNGLSYAVLMTALVPPPDGPIGSGAIPGKHVDLALDAFDFPHVVVFAPRGTTLHRFMWSGLAWVSEKVPTMVGTHSGGAKATLPPLAARVKELMDRRAKEGKTDSAALKKEIDALVEEHRNREKQEPDVVPAAGYFPRLCLDAQGLAHVTFFDSMSEKLLHGVRGAGGIWTVERVDAAEPQQQGMFSAIAVAPPDSVHVSYMSVTAGTLIHAVREGGAYKAQTADPARDAGVAVSIAVDARGSPHLAYLDASSFDLKYATPKGEQFEVASVDRDGWVGDMPAIAIDARGAPHIAYVKRDEQGLVPAAVRYATRDGGEWQVQTVDEGAGVGGHPGIGVDREGRCHVTYLAVPAGEIRHAVRQADGTWKKRARPVKNLMGDMEPGVARMALGHDGKPRILYWAGEPRTLWFATLSDP